MKNIFKRIMTVFMAVIFSLSATNVMAAWSTEYAKGDYRNMEIYSRNNERIQKPISQFAVNRVSNGRIVDKVISYDGYDCSLPFAQIECYVGDKITFEDLSRDKNAGGKIVEWDWQYYGSIGDFNHIYNYNILESESFDCTKPGETTFFLCVRNNQKVKSGCCDPWAENGNHQVKGTNKWFPKGAYWYFTAVKVIVKPVCEAKVHVRYWDSANNRIIKESTIIAGTLYEQGETVQKNIQLEDIDGYTISKWNVVLPDNTVQYSGTQKSVDIELSEYLNEKYLNVECYPYIDTGVEVRYWDIETNSVIMSEYFPGEKVVGEEENRLTVYVTSPDGYNIKKWNVQLPDGTIQYYGNDSTVDIALSSYLPKKYLNVECSKGSETGINTGLEVRYWDSAKNKIIYSEYIEGVNVTGEQEIKVTAKLVAPVGYYIENWNVQLPDGTIQYYGTDLTVDVALSGLIPKKYLNVECYTHTGTNTQTDTSVDIKYYNSQNNNLISQKTINGEKITANEETKISVELINPEGYKIDNWDLILDNGTVQHQGTEKNFDVILSSILPHKTVSVKCSPQSGGSGDNGGEITLPKPTINVRPDNECIGVIEWTETDSHKVADGYYSNGRRKYKVCTHTFEYRAVLDADAAIEPETFKSGYGFGVNVDYSLTSNLVSNTGGCSSWGANRSAVSMVKNPTTATVYIPWTMTNKLGTQATAISMEKSGSLNFILPKSNVSHTGERKIYTPVELAGTEDNPVSHSFEIYINGGGVGSVEFCKKLNGTITINGVMYDDDFSGAD